jgi:FkbH-like protein
MLIRRSTYVHLTPLGSDRVLIVHAISHLRLVIDAEVAEIVRWFDTPREMPGEMPVLRTRHPGIDDDTLAGCLASLMERGVLTDKDAAGEGAEVAARLAELHGRDPGEALDQLRREAKEGVDPYWSVTQALSSDDLGQAKRHQWDVLLFGDCDLQMEADFLRREAAGRGVDLRVVASFPDDLRLAAERPHQAILVGALRSRHSLTQDVETLGGDPIRLYLAEAQHVIEGLRAHSEAPILIDGLAEPTVQPLGLADRGPHGHRTRFRRLNMELEALASQYSGVHVVDLAAAINAEGSAGLLDDGLVGFTHFGSPGWMLQRPARELAAVHDIFPDTAPLAAQVGGQPYRREAVAARAHMDMLAVLMGLDRKKCVILDLDGTLWPGVLAETGAPFAWTPEISGHNSYIGLYFGLHEALKALKRRGVLLACVSKNDEALVRELWRYPEDYPHEKLLTPDDFVTWRVNWTDKAANIASIAEELGFALDAFVFVDDHPVERERVRQALPEVEVLGEDPFALRRILLTDPRLQTLSVTDESAQRTDLVKAQLGRDRQRAAAADPQDFLASLQVVRTFERPTEGPALARVLELFQRTTQFNTTGRSLSDSELVRHAEAGEVFVAYCRDRFGDYGLVAAAVTEGPEIAAFAMSCRVIGLQVEHHFLEFVLSALAEGHDAATARIIETSRNGPVRHLYADNGFTLDDGVWRRALERRHQAV